MSHAVRLAPALLDVFPPGDPGAAKCVAELALALHYARRDLPCDQDELARAERAVLERIHSDPYYAIVSNGFLIQQALTPYLFLRDAGHRSPFYEALMEIWREHDGTVRDAPPYRRMERAFLLHKAGWGAPDGLAGLPAVEDGKAAYAFDRDLGYAFTHTVFYATDFGRVRMPDDTAKGAAMVIAAEALGRNDIDLCLEACICLLSQDLTASEAEGLYGLIGGLCTRNARLFEARDLGREYHPLFVHDILRGGLLRRFGRDIAGAVPGDAGPFADLTPMAAVLGGKDAARIARDAAAYSARWGDSPWLVRMASARIAELARLAAHGVLFEREFARMGQRDDRLHATFAADATRLAESLG